MDGEVSCGTRCYGDSTQVYFPMTRIRVATPSFGGARLEHFPSRKKGHLKGDHSDERSPFWCDQVCTFAAPLITPSVEFSSGLIVQN